MRIQKIQNAASALQFLKNEGIKVVAVSPEGIFFLVVCALNKQCFFSFCHYENIAKRNIGAKLVL